MTLTADLKKAKTEEDVKDAYVRALELKNYSKNLVDIQTRDIWFEAKEAGTSPVAMFAQLLIYVKIAHDKGEHLPPFLAVIDREKAAIMETVHAVPLFKDKTVQWPKSGSRVVSRDKVTQEFVTRVSDLVAAHYVVYNIDSHEKEFIHAAKMAIKEGRIIRTPITPNNLRQVFDKWVEMIGSELGEVNEADYALLFFADIMHDGYQIAMNDLPALLLFNGPKPVFVLGNTRYELASDRGYRNFWAIYHRPPDEQYRRLLIERRDTLLPLDERSFKGAFYTPLKVVDKAYDLLAETLGQNWQQNYLVWDMCCGVGNLETKHSNPRNIFMSTLDQADIDVMKASRTCAVATKFQYDYLNDDIDAFGQIDYGLTNKVPKELQQAIADAKAKKKGAKKILVLMNPPYAEATSSDNTSAGEEAENKTGVARTKFVPVAKSLYGKASNELYTQFVARIHLEMPGAALAMFSTVKYVVAPTLNIFRKVWKAEYLGGFAVPSKVFDGLGGDFPICFLVWNTAKNVSVKKIAVTVLDKDADVVGEKKFFAPEDTPLLTDWIVRPETNSDQHVPLKNAITPATATKDLRGTKWVDGGIGYFNCAGNEPQNTSKLTTIFSSGYGSGRGLFITKPVLWQVAIVFSVRRLIKPTWLNDRDQFLQPSATLSDEFKHDCLMWMLFNGSNLTAGADGLHWNNRDWSLVNHFIPFTEEEVGANGRFESRFMVDYLRGKALSGEAQAVLDGGRELFGAFHAKPMPRKIRDELKLNRPDAGWYQIRKALEANAENEIVDFTTFKSAYEALSNKLRPLVYTLGFLKE